jgi:sugar lactone lactonase YvrE
MKFLTAAALAALLFGIVGSLHDVAAGTIPSAAANSAIFVANGSNVTAYPAGSAGDVAPIALPVDMSSPSAIARDASGRIYVTNRASDTVTIYAAGVNGNVPPLAVIGGSNTGLDLPAGVALGADGKIYVVNGSANSPSVNVYPALGGSTGILNEAPVASIAGSQTLLNGPDAIALDTHGNIYVANQHGGNAEFFDSGTITVYRAGSNGNVAPSKTIGGDKTGLALPVGIAVDSDRNVYTANFVNAAIGGKVKTFTSITVYSAGSKGNAAPTATIAGKNANLRGPSGIALDSSRNIYVTEAFSVEIFSAGSNGNVSPAATITGSDTGLAFPQAITLDPSGTIFVLDSGTTGVASVTVYPAGSSGNALPTATITSDFTGISGATAIALDSTGKIYVVNAAFLYDIEIYAAGSFANDGPPVTTIVGDNTGLGLPVGIAFDSNDNFFVLNFDDSIAMFPAGSVGDATPSATIRLNFGNNDTTGIAVGPGGNIYVTATPGRTCRPRSCRYVGEPSVAVFPAGSNGNASPSAVISGRHTGLGTPLAVAVDNNGNIYVANEGRSKCTRVSCGPTGPGDVRVYAPGSNGDVKPIATIAGGATGIVFPYGIALDSNANIYVLNVNSNFFGCPACEQHSIRIFAAGSNGNTAPMATIAGPSTGLTMPYGISIGPVGP